LHKEAAVFCAEHGCHMMLEKPMAMNTEECDAIIEAAQRNGVRLMIGHTQRYLPENRKAKQMIESGLLGELIMVNDVRFVGYYADTRPDWFFRRDQAGGGIVMNLGSHSIDKIQWLSDRKATRVKASLTYLGSKGDVEGSGHIWMTLAGGASATISLFGYGGVIRNETEFIFSNGMLKLQQNRGLWIGKDGVYEQVPTDEEAHPFVLQYIDLLNSIGSNKAPDVTPEYSRGIISIVQTVYDSHRLGHELDVPEV
jgi:predicted dehydrogenase